MVKEYSLTKKDAEAELELLQEEERLLRFIREKLIEAKNRQDQEVDQKNAKKRRRLEIQQNKKNTSTPFTVPAPRTPNSILFGPRKSLENSELVSQSKTPYVRRSDNTRIPGGGARQLPEPVVRTPNLSLPASSGLSTLLPHKKELTPPTATVQPFYTSEGSSQSAPDRTEHR